MKCQIVEVCLKPGDVDEREVKWNVMYLVPPECTSEIQKLCVRSAFLVIPKSAALQNRIRETLASRQRHDDLKRYEFIGQTRASESSVQVEVGCTNIPVLQSDFTVLVPILGRWNKELKTVSLAYLTGERHAREADRPHATRYRFVDFPEEAYIQTPDGVIQPICLACPNSINGMLGECKLGGTSCLDHLALEGIPSFKRRWDDGAPADTTDYRGMDGEELAATGTEEQQ